MYNFIKTKKTVILLVALLVLATALFAACSEEKFTPLTDTIPSATPVGNGGVAVKYGDWIYYVNGYESSSMAENTYVNVEGRVGSIVRIKTSDIEALLEINKDSALSSSAKAEKIANTVREKAQTVVPNIYYTANNTTTSLNGIYIFNDRLYILTPNDELTAGGNALTTQSVLTSYNLNGGDMKRHYVFEDNSAQIMFNVVGEKLFATYAMGTSVYTLDVASATNTTVDENVSSVTFDTVGGAIFFISEDKEICKLSAGATEHSVIVANPIPDGKEESPVTYTIKSVNDGKVYYTKADSNNSSVDAAVLYYATNDQKDLVAFSGTTPSTFYGWNDGIVFVKQIKLEKTLYEICTTKGDGQTVNTVLSGVQNDKAITFNKIEGNVLYYTANNVSYTLDLSVAGATPVAYATSLSTTATGWAIPDVLGDYVFTLANGSVSLVKFDATTKTNSASISLTLTPAPVEDAE